MKKRSSKKVAKVVINVTNDGSSSENSLFDQSLSSPIVLPSASNNDISIIDENVRQQLQTIADQSLTPDVNKNEPSVSTTTENTSKRKEAPTKQCQKNKAARTSGDSVAASSLTNIDEDEENDPQSSTSVWKYATRTPKKKAFSAIPTGLKCETRRNFHYGVLRLVHRMLNVLFV